MLLKEWSELMHIQRTRWRVCQCSFCKLRILSTTKHVLVLYKSPPKYGVKEYK